MAAERYKPGQILVSDREGYEPVRVEIVADHGDSYDWRYPGHGEIIGIGYRNLFSSLWSSDPEMEDWRVEAHSTAAVG